MAYIGKTPVIGNFVKLDSITVVNGQAAYTMQNGGVNFTSYDNVNQFLVSLNGILQAPTDSFTVSGSTLTFASNLSTGDVIDFVLVLGNSLDIGTPSDNTVTAAKLNNTSITGQTAETTVADDDTVLIHDTSASALRKMTVSNLTANAGIDGWSSSSGNLLPADASKGIYLGVNSATASNLLDDYEEGTFTPEITDGIGSRTHSKQDGAYTKIGNLCYVRIRVELSAGTANGNHLTVSGLPFTSANTTTTAQNGFVFPYIHSSVINSTTTNPPTLYLQVNSTAIKFYKTNGVTFTGNDLNSASTADFYIAGVYNTA